VLRNLFIALLFIALPYLGNAQGYYNVTHTSGKRIIAGVEVEVVPIDSPGVYPDPSYCVGPYFIGTTAARKTPVTNGYEFRFSVPVRQVRFKVSSSDYGEELSTFVNGSFFTLNAANLSSLSGCGNSGHSYISNGKVNFDSATRDNSTQITIASSGINSIDLYDLIQNAGSVFSFQFVFDTTVSIVNYTDTLLCAGDSIHIAYKLTGSFLPGNVFTFQLSDKSGSFANPTILGTKADTANGMFEGIVPSGLTSGDEYRVRIVSSKPGLVSEPNDKKIGIGNPITVRAYASSPVCLHDTFILGATVFSHYSDFFWNGPGVPAPNFASEHIKIPDAVFADSGMYYVEARDYGCKSFDSVYVVVRDNPIKSIGTSSVSLCTGDTIRLYSKVDTGNVQNIWKTPSGTQYYSNSISLPAVKLSDSGAYTLLTIADGCMGRDTVDIEVKQRPSPVLFAGNVCTGDTLRISAGYIPGATYEWSGPGSIIFTARDTAFINATTTLGGSYKVKITANGCEALDSINASVKARPYKPNGSLNTPLCELSDLHLSAFDTTVAVSYYWTTPSSDILYGSDNYIRKIGLTESGTYILVAEKDGCKTTDSFDVQVMHTPIPPQVSYNNPVKQGDELILSIEDPEPGVDYKWMGPNNFYSSMYSPHIKNVTTLSSGNYTVNALLGMCKSSSELFVDILSSLDTDMVVLYPNPCNGNFWVKAIAKTDQKILVHIVNAAGQLVYSKWLQTQDKHIEQAFELRDALSSGVYNFRIRLDGKTYTIPFVVDRY